LLLQDDRGPETAVQTGISYALASPPPALLFISNSVTRVTISWTAPGTLQCSGLPFGGTWTNLPAATSPYTLQAGAAQEFFRLAQ